MELGRGQGKWLCGWGLGCPTTPHSLCCPQYRLAPIPRVRYYFACASLVFICILLIHVLLLYRSVGGRAGWSGPPGSGEEGWGPTDPSLGEGAGRE